MRLIEQFKAIFGQPAFTGQLSSYDPSPIRAPLDQIAQMESRGELYYDCAPAAQFQPTHQHIKTGGYYRVTGVGRLEVTGDQSYALVEYENADGKRFAQRSDRFFDGRFQEVLL